MGGRPSVRCQGAPLLSMRMPCCHGAATPGICLIIAFSAPVPMVSGPCAAGPTPRADGPGAHGGDGGYDFLSCSLQLPSGYPWHRIRRNIPKQPHHPHYLQRCRLVKPADGGGCCQATREHQSCPGKRGEPLHGLFGRRQGHPCPRLPPPPRRTGRCFFCCFSPLLRTTYHPLGSFALRPDLSTGEPAQVPEWRWCRGVAQRSGVSRRRTGHHQRGRCCFPYFRNAGR